MEDRPASEDYYVTPDEGDDFPKETWSDRYYYWFNRQAEQWAAWCRTLGLL